MRRTVARALSIVGHPLCLLPVAALVAIGLRNADPLLIWTAVVAFLSLSLVVLMFLHWQVRIGRWQDIDASEMRERRSLSYFLAVVLTLATFVSAVQSLLPGVTVGLAVSAGMVVVAILLAPWVKLSLHVAFGVYASAVLLHVSLWLLVIGLCISAAVAWSRLELQRHTIFEVLMGAIAGGVGGGVFVVLLSYHAS